MAIQDKEKRAREAEGPEGEPLRKKKKKKKRAPEAAEPTTAKKVAPEPVESDDGAAATEEDEARDGAALVALGKESASIEKAGDDIDALAPEAAREGEELEDEPAAAQLGVDRYVLAAFFAVGMIGAYVIGRLVHGLWSNVANKDWFSQAFPRLAAVSDDDKGTIGVVLGGAIALVVVLRIYRRPDIREWADDVAAELTKVKWPTKKDVTNSTLVVIAASTVATVYLFLLDRLWAFVTNLVYGSGS